MKKRVCMVILAVLLVAVLAVSLVACYKPGKVDDDAVKKYSGFNKKPSDSVKGTKHEEIDFEAFKAAKDPIELIKKAMANTANAKQVNDLTVTNTDINSDPSGDLKALQKINQRSTYMVVRNGADTYVQTISGMMDLKTDDELVNGIIDNIIGMFGYVRRTGTLGGVSYYSDGSNPKFTEAGKPITLPGGASASFKGWKKGSTLTQNEAVSLVNDLITDGDVTLVADPAALGTFKDAPYVMQEWTNDEGKTGTYAVDPITGFLCNYVETKAPFNDGSKKGEYSKAIYITSPVKNGESIGQYEMTYNVVDKDKSTITKKNGYWEAKLVYQSGDSVAPDYYSSKIDQACRGANGMLLADLNNTPLVMGRMQFNKLEMIYQIWDNGLMKQMDRTESFSCYASFDVVIKKGHGIGYADNSAYAIYSYEDQDCNVGTFMTGLPK